VGIPVYKRGNFYVDLCGITEITYQPEFNNWKLIRFNQKLPYPLTPIPFLYNPVVAFFFRFLTHPLIGSRTMDSSLALLKENLEQNT
jgi:hypothetical protein